MPTIDDYNNWKQRQRAQEVAQTGIVLNDARKTNPDEYAADVKLGKAFGVSAGLATAGRDVFQSRLNSMRNSSMLRGSPRTAQWLKESDNARAAWDDVENLTWFEGFGRGAVNTGGRAVERTKQIGNQFMLNQTAGRARDRSMTFGEIFDDARSIPLANGGELKTWDGSEIVSAFGRWVDARYADMIGADDEGAAREYAAGVQANIDRFRSLPKSAIATEAEGSMFVDGATPGQALKNIGETALQNPIGVLSWALETAGESAPQLVAGVGATAITRNPAAGLAVQGAGSYLTERYIAPAEFLAEKGINLGDPDDVGRVLSDPDLLKEANERGVIRGLVIGAFDLASGGVAGRALSRNPFAEAVAQGLSQAISGSLGEYSARKLAGQEIDWNEIMAEGLAEIATAPIDMATAGRKFMQERSRAVAAEETKQTIDQIGEASASSKLRQRLDGSFMDFVGKATDGTPVQDLYVPAAKLQELFQSLRYDPQDFIDDLPGVELADYDMALSTGGDIRIPTAVYASKLVGSDADSFLRENMRFSPEAMTFSEAQEFNARATEIQLQAFEEAEAIRQSQEAERSVSERETAELTGRLRAAGRSADVAGFEAMPIVAMRRTMAERTGMTPEEFEARYPLPEIRRERPEGLGRKGVDELSRQLAEMRAYISQPEKRGPSLLEAIDAYGGIDDTGGELKARDASVVKRGRFQKSLRLSRGKTAGAIGDLLGKATGAGKKHGFDDVAQAMIAAGYMQDNATANEYRHAMETGTEVPDIGRALLEAIDEELRGNKQYATTDDGDAKAKWVDDAVSYFDSLGVSLNDSDDAIRAALDKATKEDGKSFGQASLRQKMVKLRAALADLVATAKSASRGESQSIAIAQVSDAVADVVEQQAGIDIRGFQHTIDTSAIRHILKNHGDAKSEAKRGMVAITESDLLEIPNLISTADQIVTGAKGKRGEDLIGYLKKMDDGTTLYIEEARRGRKALAAVSMRKYPATSDYSGIAKTISPNVRNDGGNEVIITDVPAGSKTLFQDARRGSIQLPLGGAQDSPAIISLFQSADLSTVIHESGHYFLFMLQDMATPPGVSTDIVEMYGSVQSWWAENADAVAADAKRATGVEVSGDQVRAFVQNGSSGSPEVDAAVEVGMHEQFARAFEGYLMEGKAPSVELRSAFERFAQWLVRLYKSLRGLNVSVSPEMRAVFDRMLATDAEIDAARSDLSDQMLFAAAEAAGVSPEDYRHLKALHEQAMDDAKARLRKEVMAPIVRERQQWFKDEKAKVEEEVTKRLQSMPVYRAIQEMRFGKTFDGEEVGVIKLDRATVEAEYGAGHIPYLPGATKKGHGHVMAVFGSNGLHPDVVAGMYGFDSGRALLDELENVPPIKDAIKAETDRVMFERHGDILRDGSIEEEAIAALHGDKRGQFLAAELNVLNRKVGGKTTTSQEARETVRRTMRDMKVRDAASPRRYLAAERKAANEAANAMAAGKVQDAAAAKRRQLLNYHFFMEAAEREQQIDSVVEQMRRLNKPDHRLSKSRDIDYVKAARAIAGQFGLARPPSDFNMRTWLDQLKADDIVSHDSLAQAIHVFESSGQRSYRDITINEFDEVKDAIENLLATGKLAREAEIDGKKVEMQAIRDELLQIARQRSKGKNVALERKLTAFEKIKVKALSQLAALRRAEAWARDMDDGQAGSYVRYIINPVMDALGVYRQEKAKRLRELLDIIQPRKSELLGAAISAPELGYTFENKGELLHAILHTGNDSNRKKLLVGRKWEDGWDAFIARMHNEGIVTKADYDTAQQIWDLMEQMKRPAQSAHRKMFGFYFNEIEPSPVETPFGTYRGGYVPAIADGDASVDGMIREDQQALSEQASSAMFPTTGRGFTKSRSEGYTTPLALDLLMIPSHMDKVLRFTHIQPAIQQTARIVNNPEFRTVTDEVSPGIIGSMVIPWLQRAAQQAVEIRPTTDDGRAFAGVVREIRRRVGVHTMFLNIVNTFQQVTGFSTAMVLVKPGRVKSALFRFVKGDAGDMRREASALSAFMEDRIENATREMQVQIKDAVVKPGALGIIREKSDKYGYILQQGAQNVIDVIVWHAAYDQAIAGGMDQANAVREADSVIRRTMGSFAPEDISKVEGGGAFVRLFTMFYSYFNGQANLVGGEIQSVMRVYGYRGAPRAFSIYMYGFAIPAIVGTAIVQAARGELLDDDDDDGYLDEIAALFFGSQVQYATAMVPAAGQSFNLFLNSWDDAAYNDRLSTSPVIPLIERTAMAPRRVYDAIVEGKSPTRAVQDSMVALGMILGIPTGQLAKTAGYAGGIAEGKSNPEGVIDLMQGAISGRDGSER